ncbi:nucleoid-associated protein [Maledivibacter halophilus]|uniref:Nucleoid-associated protein n=1 Tax=Maledivibacter halophilus TaxID=36842 RepID=A0A1T5M925_9FIRM|nr:nucleoid-associated protein [Maledivibacter halophilus]SKC84740.1 hypothetical protein SAMN02194393_04197 [Maledivibacter halophilus]
MDSNIIVDRLIVHVLDISVGTPVLANLEYNLDSNIKEYIENHILKIFKDIDLKKVYFKNDDNNIKKNCLVLKNKKEDFVDVSKDIASMIYFFINQNPDIPSADLVCTLFEKDGCEYFGILKFNYKESYIHFIQEDDGGRDVRIIKQKTALPTTSQKIDECIIINMNDLSILLKEKKYEIDGEKQLYLSKKILQSTEVLSDKEKVDIINKASKKVVKKYCNDDVTKMAEIRNAMAKSFEDSSTINIEEIGDKVFTGNLEIQKIYAEEIEKQGLKEKSVTVNENVEKRINKKQRLVTDDGIEIKLPTSYMTRKDKVEFVTNIDGTISILLKNINEIKDK